MSDAYWYGDLQNINRPPKLSEADLPSLRAGGEGDPAVQLKEQRRPTRTQQPPAVSQKPRATQPDLAATVPAALIAATIVAGLVAIATR